MRRTASDRRPTPNVPSLAIALVLLWIALPAQARNLSPIVFVSFAGGQSDLWVMQGDGSNLVNLTHDKTEDDFAEWSPDGRRIVWTRGGRGPEAPGSPREQDHPSGQGAPGVVELQLFVAPGLFGIEVGARHGEKGIVVGPLKRAAAR